jgi:hypothetical protein
VFLNPIFFVAMVWAAVAVWRRPRNNLLMVYFFSMGAPLFLSYLAYTFHSTVLPNWIAPSVLPLLCLTVMFWDAVWQSGVRQVKGWLVAGLSLGFTAVLLSHDTDLIGKISGYSLPANRDPLRRMRAWTETARVVGEARAKLLTEGKPVFIIANHYGMTGQLSFYLPEAKTRVGDEPLVYFRTMDRPVNQFYFWPGYRKRQGQNAIFVQEASLNSPEPRPPPARLENEFDSVTSLGVFEARYRDRVFRRVQLFACRDLR